MIPDMIGWLCGNANERHGGEVYEAANIQDLIDEVARTYDQHWTQVEVTGLTLLLFKDLFDEDGNTRTASEQRIAAAEQRAEQAEQRAKDKIEQIAAASRLYVEELQREIAGLKREVAAGTNIRAIKAMQAARTLIFSLDAPSKDRHWKGNVLEILDGLLAEAGHPVVLAGPASESVPNGQGAD